MRHPTAFQGSVTSFLSLQHPITVEAPADARHSAVDIAVEVGAPVCYFLERAKR